MNKDEKFEEQFFYKKKPTDTVWRYDDVAANGKRGRLLFSFDKKHVFNMWTDYPSKLTKEQKEAFDKDYPYWADFFKERKHVCYSS